MFVYHTITTNNNLSKVSQLSCELET